MAHKIKSPHEFGRFGSITIHFPFTLHKNTSGAKRLQMIDLFIWKESSVGLKCIPVTLTALSALGIQSIDL